MKRMIFVILGIAVVITAVLFFINVDKINMSFFYKLLFTILFEALLIIWFGLSTDFKNMNLIVRIVFFCFIIVMAGLQFLLLYNGPQIFKWRPYSKMMTTTLLSLAGIEIIVCFVLFTVGNLFSDVKLKK